jgi:hypothetical protein
MVGDVRFACERDGHDFHRLIVVQGLEDETVELFDFDRRLAGGLSRMVGQVVS